MNFSTGRVSGREAGNGAAPGQYSPDAALFELQMRMAGVGLGEPRSQSSADTMDTLDTDIMRNALTLDALVTLSKIKSLTDGPKAPAPVSLSSAGPERSSGAGFTAETAGKTQDGRTGSVRMEDDWAAPSPEKPGTGPMTGQMAEKVAGMLSALFESGPEGIASVGYDRVGGTSYGKFQLASRAGTMDRFIGFLRQVAPQWADRLAGAGPANTRSTTGGMPEEWKKIANEDPGRFEELQTRFIRDSYFDPALGGILKSTGVDLSALGPVVEEVLWSTSVQHGVGGAVSIFSRALDSLGPEERGRGVEFAKKLIQSVYDQRATQFGSSTDRVRQSVQNRFLEEKNLAVSMLMNEAGILG